MLFRQQRIIHTSSSVGCADTFPASTGRGLLPRFPEGKRGRAPWPREANTVANPATRPVCYTRLGAGGRVAGRSAAKCKRTGLAEHNVCVKQCVFPAPRADQLDFRGLPAHIGVERVILRCDGRSNPSTAGRVSDYFFCSAVPYLPRFARRGIDSLCERQKEKPVQALASLFGDPYGNRTHDYAVRGRRLSLLTKGPISQRQ